MKKGSIDIHLECPPVSSGKGYPGNLVHQNLENLETLIKALILKSGTLEPEKPLNEERVDIHLGSWMPPCQSGKVECQTSEAPVRAAKHTNTGKTIDPGSLMPARHKCFRAITI